MARPPIFDRSVPMNGGEATNDYFRALINDTRDHVRVDGIQFDFAGYTKTIEEYSKLKHDEGLKAYELAQDLSMWIEYISDLYALVEKAFMDAETSKIAIFNRESMTHDPKTVGRGDRYANQSDPMVEIRSKRNSLKSLLSNIDRKLKALEKMYYFCKYTWERAENERVKKEMQDLNAKNF